MRLKPFECIPPFRRFLTWIQEFDGGEEYRMAVLKLPSYRLTWCIFVMEHRWHQLVLVYHGRDGLYFEWWAVPTEEGCGHG